MQAIIYLLSTSIVYDSIFVTCPFVGLGNPSNSSQPADVNVLQTLVDTAAECDAFDFLHMIFNTSAGKVIFDAYKDILPLPEDTAKVNGHEKTAHFLREVFQRYG